MRGKAITAACLLMVKLEVEKVTQWWVMVKIRELFQWRVMKSFQE
jgi:hypothetical protein